MDTTLRTSDGLLLQLRIWLPEGGRAPRGTVVLVHGLGEHAGRYDALARVLAADGWRVVAHDQRGHGQSEGARGALNHPDDLLRDLSQVLDGENLRPIVLLGHSMGGAVAARYVAEGLSPPVDALVLSSPALDPGLKPLQRLMLAVAGPLLPGLPAHNGLKPAWISRDPAVVAAYTADPLVHSRITPRLARFIVEAGEQVRRAAPRWSVPTLLLYAGADRCVAPSGSRQFAQAAPADRVEARCFGGLYHEILNEPERAEVIHHLRTWLDRRFPAAPAYT